MIVRVESPPDRPAHSFDDSTLQPPPVALEYQPSQAQAPRRRDMVWGVVISILIANGVGWVIFGMLMMLARVRDDEAGPVAVGAAFIVLGVGLAASLAWTRRQQHQPQMSR